MPKWMKPTEELPECEAGDRILCIVREARRIGAPVRPTLLILEATEDGWTSPDDVFAGYSVHDCELWAYERDVARIADAIDCDGGT